MARKVFDATIFVLWCIIAIPFILLVLLLDAEFRRQLIWIGQARREGRTR
jgi:hypothetical protein